jgi:suppressor for copper-sensitivity B
MPNRFLTCLAVAVASWWASDSRAQTHVQPDISTELVVGEVSTNADPFRGWIGVRVRLGSGWKIYWKEPGDAGLPPEFDWSASSNLASAEVHWPAPHRTAVLGVESLGYTGEVLFPVSVQLIDANYDASAGLRLVLYACNTICIREERVLTSNLSSPSSPEAQALIDVWRNKVPTAASFGLASLGDAPPSPVRDRGTTSDKPPSTGSTDGNSIQGKGDFWWAVLVVAWLGGVILNLMPCVLPVLSLKLLTLVTYDVRGARGPRIGFVASAAGVIVSFLMLAAALVAFRAAGASIGWGIQFQQPVFLAVMAGVTALFAANLLGVFDVALPHWLMNVLARKGLRTSILANFAGGFVASLLATPCSAPFVGTAVGFALSRGPLETFAVFGVLGVGMATPYLLVAGIPGLALLMPRPGPWMLWLRRALAIPLLATAAWLIWLLTATAGPMPAALTSLALAVSFIVLWWRQTRPWSQGAIIAAALLGLSSAGLIAVIARSVELPDRQARRIVWHSFGELDALVQSGRTVFLDVTADWCVTCKINKALVVNDSAIAQRLASDVVPVRADWTRPDPRIGEYLKSFGRYGLPFNVVFGPGAPEGIVLPELLTTNGVLAAFAKSSSRAQPGVSSEIKPR